MLVIKKKNRSRTGDSSGEYTSNTCKRVHTKTHTYANNKELHRHWVTLKTLTNKHICAHRHMQANTHGRVNFHINSVSRLHLQSTKKQTN